MEKKNLTKKKLLADFFPEVQKKVLTFPGRTEIANFRKNAEMEALGVVV